MAAKVDFKPVTDLDPNAFYHITEARVDDNDGDFGSMLIRPSDDTLFVQGANGVIKTYWQFQPVDTDSHDARYAVRTDFTSSSQLSVCQGPDETKPCLAKSEGSDEQKWDIADWGDGSYRFTNAKNGSKYWMDCHKGSNVFMNPAIETSVRQPAQHWLMTSHSEVNDGAYSTTYTQIYTTATDGPVTTDASDNPSQTGDRQQSPQNTGGSDSGDSGGSNGLSAGAAAGIGVGAGLGVIVLALAGFLLLRRRRRRSSHDSAINLTSSAKSPATPVAQLSSVNHSHSPQQSPLELPESNYYYEVQGENAYSSH